MLEVGSIAPDFTLLDQNGDSVSLSNFVGKKIFYIFIVKIIRQAALNKLVDMLKTILDSKKKTQ